MADNLGGLFDSDPGFLEELASGAGDSSQSVAPTQQPMSGMMQGNMQMMQQQGHPQSYNMNSNYPNMQYQSQQQQSQFQQQNYSQYNNQQMYNQSMNPSQTQGHINPMMSPNHNRQYGNQQSGVMHQGQQNIVYGNYNSGVSNSAGPRLPNPSQQVNMSQMQGWNGNQRMYNMQAQQQQQQQQQSYLPQRDYSIPNTSNQQVPHMQQYSSSQSQQKSSLYVQQQQAGMVHGGKTSQPSTMGMQQQMYQQHSTMPGASTFPDVTKNQVNVASDPMLMQQQSQSTQQQFMQQQQPNPQQYQQQFPYHSPQIQAQSKMNDNIVNSQPQGMPRFQQSSPAPQNQAQLMPYGNMKGMNAMGQQRQSVPMLSPRANPSPVSPSLTPTMLSPTGSTSSLPGTFNQMEASPQKQAANATNNLYTTTDTAAAPTAIDQNKPNFPFNQTMNQIPQQPMNQAGMPMQTDGNIAANNPGMSPQSQGSPIKKVMSPSSSVTSPKNVNMEIQNVNQQIQQLYAMPQNPNTQQKIHELQEKLQMLKTMLKSPRLGQTQPLAGQQQMASNVSPPQQPLQSNIPPPSQQQPMRQEQPLQSNLQPTAQQQQAVPNNVMPQQQTVPNNVIQQQQPVQNNVMPQRQSSPNNVMPQQAVQNNMMQQQQQSVQPVPQQVVEQQPNRNQSMSVAPSVVTSELDQVSPSGPVVQPASGQLVSPGAQNSPTPVPNAAAISTTSPQKIIIIQQPQQTGPRMSSTQSSTQLPGQQSLPTLTTLPQPVLNGSTPSSLPTPSQQQLHIVLQKPQQPGAPANTVPPVILRNVGSAQESTENTNTNNQQQEKANKIIAEAIAKAQKSGNTAIPKVIQPPELPSTLGEIDSLEPTPEVKKKKKRKYTPKKDREKGKDKDKDKDGNTENTEKPPKEKKRKRSKKSKEEKPPEPELIVDNSVENSVNTAVTEVYSNTANCNVGVNSDDLDDSKLEIDESMPEKPKKKKKKPKKEPSEKTPKTEKKSKKPPATFLKNKKRKRRGSSDGSGNELKITPPPSPENDDLKRRSGRNVKRKKYMDDVDLNLSDNEDTIDMPLRGDTGGAVVKPVLFVENPAEEDAVVVDKILGHRMRKPDPDDEDADQEEVEEYFVKYKNFSYLHCEWKTEAEIRDKRIPGKIKRYKMKKMHISDIFDEDEELFNPDYVEVDRVLEESKTIDPKTQEEITHYLVKWRSLAYEDSTWELQQDVDPEKVKIFKRVSALPPEDQQKRKPRPKASEWKELKECHEYKGGNRLREYQLEGVNWLTFNYYKRQNCILADEMGLGKTIQSITFLQEVANCGIMGPFLVVAPLSTIANWQREFETWTDINAITYHGTSPSRYMLQEYEMYYRDEEGNKIKGFYKFHAIITTYEIILSDLELLRTIDWRSIIIDEAHRLKNKNCSLIKCLRIFNFEHKVLLSGTPLQNNVEELFSLLNFLEPSQFPSSDAFLIEFGTLHTEEQVDKLKAILKPMMLRRLKEDVEKNLARKEETIIEVELTNIQKKYYRAILEKNFSYLCKGANSTNVPSLLNTMMELRKCCNHPYLLNGAEENILSELRVKEGKEPEHIGALIQASGKFVLLDKLLPKLKQTGHRVLIFSQMIRVLDIIEDYLIHKKYLYERLDGRIRGNLRQEAIDRYSKPDSDRFVFLICTKAGGLGINLTAADTVIIYDSDWNPQNDLQAQARCHRIGQSKMVKVYRLITRNSYEREMFNRASMKLGLDKAVLQSMGGEKISPQQQLTKREIEDLLRKGAYGALMDDDSAGDKFCEEDIEQILKGRTQVIQIESEGKGSTFSKASFSVTSNRDDIDINDPEFWQKWAKKADVDTDTLETRELIVDEPRVRKRTARYGNNDNLDLGSDLGSDSNTDDEEGSRKSRKSRRNRKGDEDEDFEKERHRAKPSGSGYGRSELFKVEKGLLHYGWGRWKDILSHARFKRPMEEKDVENVAKAILLYGLQYYKGDERIKEFISDLIAQEKDGGLKNHSGLSAPVPRGRKGKKAKDQECHFDANEEIEKAGIKMDRDIIFNKNAYKRHIHRHSNKVLLRVRTLYYLKHEVLGDVVDQIDQGMHVKDVSLGAPSADNEPPTYWWDELADKSLLVGTYKHGYEKYNLMRQDPMLVFLEKCGPPDGAALAAEMKDDDDNDGDDLDETVKDDEDEDSLACASDAASTPKRTPSAPPSTKGDNEDEEGKMPFPTASEMNTRLRRIITTYQRDFKKQQIKQQQQAKKMEKREKMDAMFKEREARKRETQMKWTRREETDFYRVVSTYGIEFDRHKGRYIWDKFRVMAKLEKKTDEQLTEYFISFYHMCLRVCRKIKEEAYPPTPVYIEPVTEERANRCIARIDLLSKIREEIVVHPKMESRSKQCQKSLDLPSWWISGRHDKELLIGAAKHGLARTDYYIMNDPALSFLSTIKAFVKSHSVSPDPTSQATDKDTEKKVKVEEPEEKTVLSDVKSEHEDEAADIKKEVTNKGDNEASDKDSDDKPSDLSDKHDSSPKKQKDKSDSDKLECDKSVDKDSDAKDKDNDTKDSKDNEVEDKDSETKDKVEDMEVDGEKDEENVKSEYEPRVKKKEMDVKKDKDSDDKAESEEKTEFDKTEIKAEDKEDSDTEVEDNAMDIGEDGDNEGTKKVKEEKTDDVKKEEVEKEVKEELADVKDENDEEVISTLDEDSQSDLINSVPQSLLAQWPKDRLVFHRLEQICYCIETGDWPFPPKMKNVHILGIDSNSNTPTRSLTPKQEEDSRPSSVDRAAAAADRTTPSTTVAAAMAAAKKERDFEGEGLKMTFHKKLEKATSKRPSVDPMEAEKKARIQAILTQTLSASQASNDDSQPEPVVPSMSTVQVSSWAPSWLPSPPPPTYIMSPTQAENPFLNGTGGMTEEELMMNRHLLEQGLLFPRSGRRGRKRKEEKMAEIAMAEALARRQAARVLSGADSEARVPVINLEDGSRLSGEDAPLKKNLEHWLDQHPGYMVDNRMEELEEGEIERKKAERERERRKMKVDPSFLEVEKLTGEENVSVVNRVTGKRITGAKAPPLRYLAEWLEQNPTWDVDPKWAELVKQKGTLPKQLLPRVGASSSRRGRRPRDSPLSHSMLGATDPHQAAALAASMEAMNAANLMGLSKLPLPFASIPGLGLNPMLGLSGLSGFGFPGLPGSPLLGEKSESKHKDSKSSKDEDKLKDEDKSSPHPSFPLLFNPLLYNPALIAAHGLANFSLPTSLAGLDTSLLNGHSISSTKEETATSSTSSKSSHHSSEPTLDLSTKRDAPEDLSIKRKVVIENTTEAHSSGKSRLQKDRSFESDDMPCDLSMKPKPKESKEEKSKQKICSSDKLSRIVDTLKCRVNKMDEKPSEDERRSSLDNLLGMKERRSEGSSSRREEGRSSSSSKKDLYNSMSHKHHHSSSSSNHHGTKETVPKIVQELLAAKQLREQEELLLAKQQKLNALMASQLKHKDKERSSKSHGAQGSDDKRRADSPSSDKV